MLVLNFFKEAWLEICPGKVWRSMAETEGTTGKEEEEEEPSMKDLMREMRSMHIDLGGQFVSLQNKFADLRVEVTNLKKEMVTKEIFSSLESRVAVLEVGGVGNAEVTFLKKQVNRLDPSSKCLYVSGFKD